MMFERLLHVNGWVLFGMLGQILFGLRFIVQWLASERRKETTVPVAFWSRSLAGSLILFISAFWYRQDIVITVGQSAGVFIYVRNLMLIRRPRPGAAVSGSGGWKPPCLLAPPRPARCSRAAPRPPTPESAPVASSAPTAPPPAPQ